MHAAGRGHRLAAAAGAWRGRGARRHARPGLAGGPVSGHAVQWHRGGIDHDRWTRQEHHGTAGAALQVRADWDAAALQEVLAYARSQKTTGLLIIHDRQIVAEQHWPLP